MKKEYEFEDKGEEMGEDHESDGPREKKHMKYPGIKEKALKVNMGIGKSGLKAEHEPGYTKEKEEGDGEKAGLYRRGIKSLAKMANARKGLSYGEKMPSISERHL